MWRLKRVIRYEVAVTDSDATVTAGMLEHENGKPATAEVYDSAIAEEAGLSELLEKFGEMERDRKLDGRTTSDILYSVWLELSEPRPVVSFQGGPKGFLDLETFDG